MDPEQIKRNLEVDKAIDTYLNTINDEEVTEHDLPLGDGDASMFNVFLCYYKSLFNKKESLNMFDEIDGPSDEGTNRCMELFYEESLKFHSSDDQEKNDLFPDGDQDIDDCIEMFGLYVDNKLELTCKFVMPLIKYVSTKNWSETYWSIISLKSIDD